MNLTESKMRLFERGLAKAMSEIKLAKNQNIRNLQLVNLVDFCEIYAELEPWKVRFALFMAIKNSEVSKIDLPNEVLDFAYRLSPTVVFQSRLDREIRIFHASGSRNHDEIDYIVSRAIFENVPAFKIIEAIAKYCAETDFCLAKLPKKSLEYFKANVNEEII